MSKARIVVARAPKPKRDPGSPAGVPRCGIIVRQVRGVVVKSLAPVDPEAEAQAGDAADRLFAELARATPAKPNHGR